MIASITKSSPETQEKKKTSFAIKRNCADKNLIFKMRSPLAMTCIFHPDEEHNISLVALQTLINKHLKLYAYLHSSK
jgi:hypothetical protein